MCCPVSVTSKAVIIFRTIEPLFWAFQVLILLNLIMPKDFFAMQLKWLNKLLKCQGFDVEIKYSEKAYKIWYRDLWILFFLVPIVIFLIHII